MIIPKSSLPIESPAANTSSDARPATAPSLRRVRWWQSLRAQLAVSYATVLILTLIVIVGSLLIVLQSQPAQTGLSLDQLAGIMQTLRRSKSDAPIGQLFNSSLLSDAAIRNLTAAAIRLKVFRILVTDQKGAVHYDSKDYDTAYIYTGNGYRLGDTVKFTPLSDSTDPTFPGSIRGTFHDTNGENWLYVQLPTGGSTALVNTPTPAPGSNTSTLPPLLVTTAVIAPRTTLSEIMRYYGGALIPAIGVALLIGIIAASIVTLLITRSVVRPLHQIADAAHAISRGELPYDAPVQGPLEVRAVAIAFNQMTEQVSETRQAQRDFLANVSHDLRTPLTSIQGFSQAIIDGVAANPESAKRAATVIHNEAGRMYRMVEELLDLARIESGRLNMTRHAVPIGEMVEAIGERLTIIAREKGISLVTDVAPDLPTLAGDGDRLAQVLTNLVDNALKHTPAGGMVTLQAQTQNNGVLITVHDTGEGIPQADLPRIFERFYQVDKSRHRREGAGLGLAIAGQIIKAHNGKIWVESQEGAWTRFSVWLPLPASDGSTIIRNRAEAASKSRRSGR